MALCATKLAYYDDMWKLQCRAALLSSVEGDDGRRALILDSTIFHPQGGGQPSDTGFITDAGSNFKFVVEDVRLKDGLVFHYGSFENSTGDCSPELEEGREVCLHVDEPRRNLNSRPFVEYKGAIPQSEQQDKQKELEIEANLLISKGGKVSAAVLSYEEACKLCGGCLPDYISKSSSPRIVNLGENPGCPCGGTHVADISDIRSLKVTQIRIKKGMTKVYYSIGP
ncbi:PREDICTED: uncharacterized protein LOC104598985 isoform X2 [Nelumbo nucifera]|uniref:Uncharacterized protein LOC104598985 isoform X2 n=2 Tax=Nelumbo nucifera TaxID=4432 RepID=A0A1U8AD13_NELNU|nr:PREDICTED: uncharacterized protein LOC104598985 isoform X2 [Nelumbo nucifera]DAD38048.1 TPA_asm: hypothetical protein HUJ06_008689 [Nelumbo nucifera]